MEPSIVHDRPDVKSKIGSKHRSGDPQVETAGRPGTKPLWAVQLDSWKARIHLVLLIVQRQEGGTPTFSVRESATLSQEWPGKGVARGWLEGGLRVAWCFKSRNGPWTRTTTTPVCSAAGLYVAQGTSTCSSREANSRPQLVKLRGKGVRATSVKNTNLMCGMQSATTDAIDVERDNQTSKKEIKIHLLYVHIAQGCREDRPTQDE
ncbi:hypothetical protein C8Q72DRAFT_797218 [Fomitopsis betulina]|nr:hypothetical protein C8Q72DRAFT_797218 [Fomitopsis betulina]